MDTAFHWHGLGGEIGMGLYRQIMNAERIGNDPFHLLVEDLDWTAAEMH
jgi:hypothetical protein